MTQAAANRKTTAQASHETDQDNVLQRKLDSLLEEYLHVLDEYTVARGSLGAQASAGFLALAQANFMAPNRARYGQDFYDGRMQAMKVVRIGENAGVQQVEIHGPPGQAHNTSSATPGDTEIDPNDSSSPKAPAESTKDASSNADDKPSTLPRDPIRWFGVFVSPALRQTQKHFQQAVDGSIAQLVNLNSKMEALEIDIRRTRKQIAKLQS